MTLSANDFELLLFSTDPSFIHSAEQAGIHGFIVDWETKNKAQRQQGFDTQINNNTLEDLKRVRKATRRRVLCRINAFGEWTREEVSMAIQEGADEIFLPMVRTLREAETTLDYIKGECDFSILVETLDATQIAGQLSKLPLKRVYVGLNDLSIERKLENIFISITDGTLDSIRSMFNGSFGFGGLTLPELGAPIPCKLLIAEMARLNCGFTYLRRSFIKDVAGKDMSREVPRILDAISTARIRPLEEVQADRSALVEVVAKWKQKAPLT